MGRLFGYLLLAITLAGFPLVIWAGGFFAWRAYTLAMHGQEMRAEVLCLDRVSGGKGKTFWYDLEIDGRKETFELAHSLPVGATIEVLRYGDTIAVGNSESTILEIYSNLIGGPVLATLFAAVWAFMLVMGPKTVLEIFQQREKFVSAYGRR
jgi:hypothetical protein